MFDLIELALNFDDACGWITRAVGRRLSTEKKLRAAMSARKKMRWRAELGDVLAAAGDGIHSVLEYRYLRDVERAHGLPRSRHQVRVVIDGKAAYRDAYYDEYQLAVELDGRLAHPDDERWRDNQRDNKAGARGIQTTRYGWRDVYGHACQRPAAGADPATARLDGNPAAVLRALPGGARVAQDGSGVTTTAAGT